MKKSANRLYFVAGNIVTAEQKEFARINNLKIRNAEAYQSGDMIEDCEGVVGNVIPEDYAKKFKVLEIKNVPKDYEAPKPKAPAPAPVK